MLKPSRAALRGKRPGALTLRITVVDDDGERSTKALAIRVRH